MQALTTLTNSITRAELTAALNRHDVSIDDICLVLGAALRATKKEWQDCPDNKHQQILVAVPNDLVRLKAAEIAAELHGLTNILEGDNPNNNLNNNRIILVFPEEKRAQLVPRVEIA